MGFSTPEQYETFMNHVPHFERMLVDSGIHVTKFWFSVSQKEQRTRFAIRQLDPVRRWKLSPMDLESLDRWVYASQRYRDTRYSWDRCSHRAPAGGSEAAVAVGLDEHGISGTMSRVRPHS